MIQFKIYPTQEDLKPEDIKLLEDNLLENTLDSEPSTELLLVPPGRPSPSVAAAVSNPGNQTILEAQDDREDSQRMGAAITKQGRANILLSDSQLTAETGTSLTATKSINTKIAKVRFLFLTSDICCRFSKIQEKTADSNTPNYKMLKSLYPLLYRKDRRLLPSSNLQRKWFWIRIQALSRRPKTGERSIKLSEKDK